MAREVHRLHHFYLKWSQAKYIKTMQEKYPFTYELVRIMIKKKSTQKIDKHMEHLSYCFNSLNREHQLDARNHFLEVSKDHEYVYGLVRKLKIKPC